MSSPEQIQADIERTRQRLSGDVDRLSDKVSPGKAAGRQMDTIKTRASSLKERVMGSDTSSTVQDTAGSVRDRASDLAGNIGDQVTNAPDTIKQQARGNPLAVGLIAFGVGWLVSSLAPATQVEQQVAEKAEAKAKEAAEPLKQAGQQAVEELKPQVQESVEQVKETARDAASETVDQARSAAQDVKTTAQP